MPAKYSVYWTESGERDLISIIEYIYLENPKAASENLKRIKTKVKSLNSFPEKGRIVPELKEQGVKLYRELIIPPWRAIFKLSDKNVYVMAVIDSRRNVEDILFERLIRNN
jgi:plasmid stabilization system protein ParE